MTTLSRRPSRALVSPPSAWPTTWSKDTKGCWHVERGVLGFCSMTPTSRWPGGSSSDMTGRRRQPLITRGHRPSDPRFTQPRPRGGGPPCFRTRKARSPPRARKIRLHSIGRCALDPGAKDSGTTRPLCDANCLSEFRIRQTWYPYGPSEDTEAAWPRGHFLYGPIGHRLYRTHGRFVRHRSRKRLDHRLIVLHSGGGSAKTRFGAKPPSTTPSNTDQI